MRRLSIPVIASGGFADGDLEAGIWSAGLAQGLIDDIPTVQELVLRIVAEAEELITGRLAGVCDAPGGR